MRGTFACNIDILNGFTKAEGEDNFEYELYMGEWVSQQMGIELESTFLVIK